MAEMKGMYYPFEFAIVGSPVEKKTMQSILQKAPEKETNWD